MEKLNRRAALVGALVSSAALAVPAVAAVREPSDGDKLQHFLDTAEPEALIQYHAAELAVALCYAQPGQWVFNTRDAKRHGFVRFYRREGDWPDSVFQDLT